jgi:hypothetical protein
MNLYTLFISAAVLLPSLALATWAWLAIAQVEEKLRSLGGFEGIDFEI